ncbi:hypothetical protein D3C75_1194580 [compost metagenome]
MNCAFQRFTGLCQRIAVCNERGCIQIARGQKFDTLRVGIGITEYPADVYFAICNQRHVERDLILCRQAYYCQSSSAAKGLKCRLERCRAAGSLPGDIHTLASG